jgi:hypothetical protein
LERIGFYQYLLDLIAAYQKLSIDLLVGLKVGVKESDVAVGVAERMTTGRKDPFSTHNGVTDAIIESHVVVVS